MRDLPPVRPSRAALVAAAAMVALAVLEYQGIAAPVGPLVDPFPNDAAAGVRGGQVVIAQRAEAKTFNPVTAVDAPSREVIRRLTADLIHINRQTLQTEPALAESWTVSADGRHYTVTLRPGLRFSDGQPCDADDVVFSFQVYLDEAIHSPQRDLLLIAGQPMGARKVSRRVVVFDLPAPYAAAERLFDSVAILPRHLLDQPYRNGTLARAWGLNTAPAAIAGMGPFRLAEYRAGERTVLERNPYYWKTDAAGRPLPFLDRLTFIQVPDDNAQALRFQAGETDLVTRLTAEDFDLLQPGQQSGAYRLYDLGPGFEYNFLFFNLNDVSGRGSPGLAAKQAWFMDRGFRQAVSAAIDRDAIVRLVYHGRAEPLWTPVTASNARWINGSVPHPPRSLDRARQLLRQAAFSWDADGRLRDRAGVPVAFSILVAAGNQPRSAMATIVQDDLKQIGIAVTIVSLEFRALLARVLEARDYEACLLGLQSGDADPSADMNVWLSSGATHLWHPEQREPATTWEASIDDLMRRQLVTLDPAARKRLFDRVQAIIADEAPIICLASPHILVGASANLANFHPAVLDHYVLSDIDQVYWREQRTAGGRR